jgi:CheY-like chemotaxis protein
VKKKILVIDDDQLIRYGLRKALQQESIEVTTASSAAAAEEELSICPYNLCLLDIHLPDYNGLDLMKIIKNICPETKIIVMTASHIDNDELSSNIKEAAENGACHFLAKPFALNEVKEIIHEALHNEEFQTRMGFTDHNFVRRTRKFTRQPHTQPMDIAMTVLGNGNTHRWTTEAESFDISEGGVGLLTSYPLPVSQVLSLQSGSLEKTGVVVWSRMLKDNTCKAGICFAWDGKSDRR